MSFGGPDIPPPIPPANPAQYASTANPYRRPASLYPSYIASGGLNLKRKQSTQKTSLIGGS